MKKLIVAALLAASAMSATAMAQANWVKVATGFNGTVIELDYANIKINGNIRAGSTRITAMGEGLASSTMMYLQVNCADDTWRNNQYAAYTPLISGMLVTFVAMEMCHKAPVSRDRAEAERIINDELDAAIHGTPRHYTNAQRKWAEDVINRELTAALNSK